MSSKDKLTCSWAFWVSHSGGSKNQSQYKGNILRMHTVSNLTEFAYVWKQSAIAEVDNFFVDPFTGKCTKFEIEGQIKKVQSINFFKNDVQPSWQYGDNCKGGYFNFSFPKQTSIGVVQKVYERLIFTCVGYSFSFCERLLGVRVVDTTSKNLFRVRFQLWMNYNQSNLEQMQADSKELNQLLSGLQVKQLMGKVKFFDIGSKKKEGEEKK